MNEKNDLGTHVAAVVTGAVPSQDRDGKLAEVSMPPPVAQDWQVSQVGEPDWELKYFTGGVERIERRHNMLIFYFVAGGQVCVNHGVTYCAPERH